MSKQFLICVFSLFLFWLFFIERFQVEYNHFNSALLIYDILPLKYSNHLKNIFQKVIFFVMIISPPPVNSTI